MWIKLPSAAIVALLSAARGFPWHGAVAGTLGVYVLSAAWALVAHGTRGFFWVVGERSWWIPAATFAVGALVTGVPGIRRRLFGARAWAKAQRRSAAAAPLLEDHQNDGSWIQSLVDSATSASPEIWDRATAQIIAGSHARTGAELLSDQSSLEKRNTGALGQAIRELDTCLSTVPAVQPGTAKNEAPLSPKQWRQLLSLDADGGSDDAGAEALTLQDRAELVTRAASHSLAAGQVLSWRWLAGLEETIESIGTAKQKETLLPLFSEGHEIVAAGWTGRSRATARAVVVREMRGKKEVTGLRVTCDLEGVVGADAATVIAITVPTFDPGGLIQRADGEEGSLGMTCLLVRPSSGLALLGGAALDERLASHSLTGLLHAKEAFVPMDHVLGGLGGVGAADDVARRCRDTWETVRTTSLLAGIGQRIAATNGSLALIRNVMCAETIEAWSHASLGATAFELNAFGTVAALIANERSLAPSEARALQAAAGRGARELAGRDTAPEDSTPPRSVEEAFIDNLPRPSEAAFEAALTGAWDAQSAWTPSWYRERVTAVGSDSHADFDLARSEGWRRLFHAAAGSVLQSLPGLSRMGGKPDPSGRSQEQQEIDGARAALVRAYSATRTAVLLAQEAEAPAKATTEVEAEVPVGEPAGEPAQRPAEESAGESAAEPSQTSPISAVNAHLQLAEERLATMAFLELAHQTEGSQPIERGMLHLSLLTELAEAHDAVSSAVEALPSGISRAACRRTLKRAKSAASGIDAALAESVAAALVANPEVLRRLLVRSYAGHAENFGTAPLRKAALMASASRVPIAAVQRAQSVGQLPPEEFSAVLDLAVERRIISSVDTAKIRACMAISQEVLSGSHPKVEQPPARHSA